MNAMDSKPPSTTHLDIRYCLPEGIVRNEISRATTKKKIVSFVINQIPIMNPATSQSFGSRRLTILMTRNARRDHHKEPKESGEKREPKARSANVSKVETAARTWAFFPPPSSLAIIPDTKKDSFVQRGNYVD